MQQAHALAMIIEDHRTKEERSEEPCSREMESPTRAGYIVYVITVLGFLAMCVSAALRQMWWFSDTNRFCTCRQLMRNIGHCFGATSKRLSKGTSIVEFKVSCRCVSLQLASTAIDGYWTRGLSFQRTPGFRSIIWVVSWTQLLSRFRRSATTITRTSVAIWTIWRTGLVL